MFLGGRYELQDFINRGGMTYIYRGYDLRMERTVAIKVLREIYSADDRIVRSFQNNAETASTLHHPNIVQVYDYGQTEDKYYMVMELVDGINLRQYLRTKSNALGVQHAISIASAIANGLAAIHQQHLIYRALKTNKVLIAYDGSTKLTSFGLVILCRDILDEYVTTVGRPLGTVQYSTPAQAQGENVS